MKDAVFTLVSTHPLTESVFELLLEGDTAGIDRPGQFVNISVPGLFLRRPVSVCDLDGRRLRLLVRQVGAGTAALRRMAPGTRLDVLTGLGNGFDVSAAKGRAAALVGGGIGLAPLVWLARELAGAGGPAPLVVLGFRTASDAFCLDAFRALGCRVDVATEDGSAGVRGFVTDALALHPDVRYVFACGPMPMLAALAKSPQVADGQFSLEARMGCGFGACVGCTVETVGGPARVCVEGPVFRKEALKW